MLINCYYYAPHNHSILVEYLDSDLEKMAEIGTDIVSFCVQESQMTNWHTKRISNVIERIHAHGMKAHAVPNRWAGIVAGWLDGFGRFTVDNPDTLITKPDGTLEHSYAMISCINNPKVIDHIRTSITQLFEVFEFDGLIWDEPHSRVCYCNYCREINPEPTEEWYHSRFAAFIDEMSHYIKTLKSDAVISLFTQPTEMKLFRALLDNKHIDYLGSDGHVRSPAHVLEHCVKRSLFDVYEETAPLLETAGEKSFYLLEAQRHRDENLDDYLSNLDRAIDLPMDHLMYYYSAHELSLKNEAVFNDATWAAVKRVSSV